MGNTINKKGRDWFADVHYFQWAERQFDLSFQFMHVNEMSSDIQEMLVIYDTLTPIT